MADVIEKQTAPHLQDVERGQVVALIGDFDSQSIADLLTLMERGAVVVPLTTETRPDHEYFFDVAGVQWVAERGRLTERRASPTHPLIGELRARHTAGLVLFTSGTTGRPKGILHDLQPFLNRYRTPRPSYRTLGFLQFDHIGGINTLLHTMYNSGTIVVPSGRSPIQIMEDCDAFDVEVLPTTPTFLRMLWISGLVPGGVPDSLKIITYGTERMDQETLNLLCDNLSGVDFRQTYGMSELGILRVKSQARNSLFMKIGGEGVDWRVEDGVLMVRSESRMIGYLNAESPFDSEGWYDTKDLVEMQDGCVKIVGRVGDVINVGGLKFSPSEIERLALRFEGVRLAKAVGRPNPISGQHVELLLDVVGDDKLFETKALRDYLASRLPPHMVPLRIVSNGVKISHRTKVL
jgi:acyl-coenzyme A synthetase/AMP-(fatty) acid ligase